VLRLGIRSDAELEPLLQSADADAAVLRRLQQMFEAGAWVLLESAVADLPADLRWLYESGAVTIEQLAALHQALGSTSLADLTLAVDRHAIRGVSGLDDAVEDAVAAALPTLRAALPRIPLGRAAAVAEPLVALLGEVPGVTSASTAGSLRRGQETVGDIEIVAGSTAPSAAIEELTSLPDLTRCLHRSERRVYLLFERVQVGVRLPPPDRFGAMLLMLTGARPHAAALQARAGRAGLRLGIDGLTDANGALVASESEEAIYTALGMRFVPPEIRNGDEDIDRAAAGTLPALVRDSDIRGDLHMHTVWSDGRDTVEAMAAACADLGYEYMAITDHSPHSSASRNLTIDGVKRQADEIAAVRERHPSMTILHGCEVDILPDGRLDFPDRILESFDVVLASLHDSAGQPPEQLLRRYLGAARHPLVSILTHPTNRLVPNRKGYDLDYERLFEAAAEHHTVMEIDGAPVHLDMDGALARRAVAAGAVVSIDSDCHRADLLPRQMRLGVATARRGWVEATHVLNTRSIADVRAMIARKRAAR
jgi:DNA polymerase (family 10)